MEKVRRMPSIFVANYPEQIRNFWETRIIRATRFHANKQVQMMLTHHKNFLQIAIILVSEVALRTGSQNDRQKLEQWSGWAYYNLTLFDWRINVLPALTSKRRFLNPRPESNLHHPNDRLRSSNHWAIRWRVQVQIRHMCYLCGSWNMLIVILNAICYECGSLEISCIIDERSSSSEKRFLSPRRGSNLQTSDDRWDPLTI